MDVVEKLFSLKGRRAVVTGGGGGLGAEMACALAAAGAAVVVVGRRQAALEHTAARIAKAGGEAAIVAADLGAADAIDEVVARAQAVGGIDVLINAAGINERMPADALGRAAWEASIRINLTVPFLLAQAVVGGMRERGWGRIINIGSLQSVRAFPDSIAYGAAKGGIVQLTRAMAEAWSADGVCCNAIAPGLFPTELTRAVFENGSAEVMAARTCIGRNGRLDDIWGVTLFLASDASAFMTGQTLFLDGGFTAR